MYVKRPLIKCLSLRKYLYGHALLTPVFSWGKTNTKASGCLTSCKSFLQDYLENVEILIFFFLCVCICFCFFGFIRCLFQPQFYTNSCHPQGSEKRIKWNKIESQINETFLRIFTMIQSEKESKCLQLSAVQKGLYDHLIFLFVSSFCLDLRELFSPLESLQFS